MNIFCSIQCATILIYELLNIKLVRHDNRLNLSQSHYTEKIVKKFDHYDKKLV